MSKVSYEEFKQPTQHDVVRHAAEILEKAQALRDAGKLTEEQYQEIGRDVLSLQDANLKLLDMRTRQHVMEALKMLAQIAGIIITFL